MYKVALDSVVDRDSSVGLVASGASGVIGLERQSVDRVCCGESVAERMNEFVALQPFDVTNDSVDDESFNIVTMFNVCTPPVNEDIRCDNVKQVANIDLRFDIEKFVADSDASMHFVDLCISDDSGNSVFLRTLFDSGTQLSILKEDLISPLVYEVLGEVKLQGFNGNIYSGKIILLSAKLAGHNVYVSLWCVACENVSQDCLLSLADYRKLLQCQEVRSVGVTPPTSTDSVEEVTKFQNSNISVQQIDDTDGNITNHVTDDEQVSDVSEVLSLDDSLGLSTTDSVDSKASELRREQLEDETLTGTFDFAKHNKSGYLIKNGLLFHRAKIFENTVDRLVCRK